MARFGTLGTQYFDNAGDPLINGKIYFKESGTDTDKDTFADVTLETKNPNPVILSGAGRQPNVFFNGSARAILTDSNDVQVEVRDPVGGDVEEGAFSTWDSLTIYTTSDIVIGSDGLFYLSITNGNQDNDPTTDAVNWSEIRFIRIWNVNETYSVNRIVEGSDGLLYTSQIDNNLGNDPSTDTTNWKSSVYVLNTKIVDIGDWNMDTTASVSVPHGLDSSKIRTVSASIRDDNGVQVGDINLTNSAETTSQGVSWGGTLIVLARGTNGTFDSTDYDSTSFNRGWITIQYID
jgi:hypothetical protein